jgi:prevent-host-death family protein
LIWTDGYLDGYLEPMRYSVAEAKNNLPKLIDRALAGEDVTITRRGKVVVSLKSEVAPVGVKLDLEWIKANRVVLPDSDTFDSAALIRQLRDEGY